jgi:drug/metabolite transporter (DMT)-like permease
MQALWMVAASFIFALMGVCVKFASAHYSATELVCYRGIVSVIFVWVWARSTGVSLGTQLPGMHAWRSLIGVVSLGGWFYAIAHLPLATAMTLNYMSSVWVAAFVVGGAMLYGQVAPQGDKSQRKSALDQGPLLATVLAGFAGVVMVLRPAFDQNQQWPGLVGLLSGMTAALAYIQVTALSRAGEPEARVVFYFAVASALLGAVGMLFTGTSAWQWPQALWILPIGILASLGQLCMTRAYASGATLTVASLQYSGIVFGAIASLVVFNDQLPPVAWAGIMVIIGSGLAATALRRRAVPDAPHDE